MSAAGAEPRPAGRDRPWRKSAAAVAAERREAATVLGCSSADGGVHFAGLDVALRSQEWLDTQADASTGDAGERSDAEREEREEESPQQHEPPQLAPAQGQRGTAAAGAVSLLQKATTALLQAATNGRSAEDVGAAIEAVRAAAASAELEPRALLRDRSSAGPSTKLQLLHLVAPRLWVGGWAALNDGCSALRARRVSHVVSVVSADKRRLPPFVRAHHYVRADDREGAAAELAAAFAGIAAFIHAARTEGGTVLVHCGAGISRAPTAAAAYLIWSLRVPAAGAISLLRRARPCVRPNVGCVKALKEWERVCLALPAGVLPPGGWELPEPTVDGAARPAWAEQEQSAPQDEE
jgi:hypothetical protein